MLKVGLLKNISRPVGRGPALPCGLVNMHLENLTGHLVTDLEHENIEIERDIWSEYTRNRERTLSRCHLGRKTCTIWLDPRDFLYFGKWTHGEEVIWWLRNPYHREVSWFNSFLLFFLNKLSDWLEETMWRIFWKESMNHSALIFLFWIFISFLFVQTICQSVLLAKNR